MLRQQILFGFVVLYLCSSFAQKNTQTNTQTNSQTSSDAQAAKNFEKRIQELEQSLKEMQERQSEMYARVVEGTGIKSSSGTAMALAGHFENAFSFISGPDTESQGTANFHSLLLNLTAQQNERVRFALQLSSAFRYGMRNADNDPDLAGENRSFKGITLGTSFTQAYGEYNFGQALKLQVGMGTAPFGYVVQLREPILFRRRGVGPQLAALPAPASPILIYPFWQGVHLLGETTLGDGKAGYHFYTFSHTTQQKTLGFGTRAWYSPGEYLTAGISTQVGRQFVEDFFAYGTDVDLKFGSSGIQFEWARNVFWKDSIVVHSYYLEPYYIFDQGHWVIYGVVDYFDNPQNYGGESTASLRDPFTKWIWGGGLNWLPYSFTRFRIGFLQHEYITHTAVKRGRDRDYSSFDLSAVIAF